MVSKLLLGATTTGLAFAARTTLRNWGATKAECRAVLPGDEFVPEPAVVITRAVTVEAPAEEAAGMVRWVVAPDRAVLRGDTNTTRTYSGTAALLLNPKALTSASGEQVLLRNVPIAVAHQTQVLGTRGDSALVSDAKAIKVGGSTVAAVDYRYAINRTNMARGSGYSGVLSQNGLTFNWPIRTQRHDYTGWVPDTQKPTKPLCRHR